MARGRTNPVLVTRVRRGDGGRPARRPDKVVVEEPMEIRLDDHLVTTTMRTPGHDFELAVGFLFTEGLLDGHPVAEVRYCATGSAVDTGFNVVSVSTNGRAPEPTPRLGTTTSSCGLCGSASIDDLAARLEPLAGPPVPFDLDVALAVSEKVRTDQELFAATGSVHAAAAFDQATGAVEVVREDVGRHNAVDKVVGRLLLDGRVASGRARRPADGRGRSPGGARGEARDRGLGLHVSGRVSFEIVQKAWAAGFGLVVGVSGPTGLAVDTAHRAGITLAGFLRGDAANLYTWP
ncbi:MAG TPA: formate dehydrogenase accessory sulfurtransferase FdhD [Acidimicrobiales bacterium]|nr:formate dehydrogenase accessory sulfurtransferase FdhD [Acidimicrobiales bacterium]